MGARGRGALVAVSARCAACLLWVQLKRCTFSPRWLPADRPSGQAVSLSALGALAAVLLLGRSAARESDLLSGDANDLWATAPGTPAVQGVSAVAGALNVFKSIAAGSPVPTTCWEPPCAPITVPVHPRALPHRLAGILKGVKLLENRLKDFKSGEDSWSGTMATSEQQDAKFLEDMGDEERQVYRNEGDLRRFLTTPGPPGAAGPMGLRGVRGAPGMIGWQGLAGSIGVEGDSGPRGRPGAPGPPGISGQVGPTGMQGYIGHEGQMGQRGPAGEAGSQGVRGRQGNMGDDGLMGPPGTTIVGLPGPPGPRGKAGPMGIIGAAGMEGSSGLEGHLGIAGGNGIPGLQGLDGGTFGNGRNIAAAAAAVRSAARSAARRGPRKQSTSGKRGPVLQMKRLESLKKEKKKKGDQKSSGTKKATAEAVKGGHGVSSHACAGGRVENKRIGNTGFFLGCNEIDEGAKIIIYGDKSKYVVGPNGLEKR